MELSHIYGNFWFGTETSAHLAGVVEITSLLSDAERKRPVSLLIEPLATE